MSTETSEKYTIVYGRALEELTAAPERRKNFLHSMQLVALDKFHRFCDTNCILLKSTDEKGTTTGKLLLKKPAGENLQRLEELAKWAHSPAPSINKDGDSYSIDDKLALTCYLMRSIRRDKDMHRSISKANVDLYDSMAQKEFNKLKSEAGKSSDAQARFEFYQIVLCSDVLIKTPYRS